MTTLTINNHIEFTFNSWHSAKEAYEALSNANEIYSLSLSGDNEGEFSLTVSNFSENSDIQLS